MYIKGIYIRVKKKKIMGVFYGFKSLSKGDDKSQSNLIKDEFNFFSSIDCTRYNNWVIVKRDNKYQRVWKDYIRQEKLRITTEFWDQEWYINRRSEFEINDRNLDDFYENVQTIEKKKRKKIQEIHTLIKNKNKKIFSNFYKK